jgi:hypothetical protein
MSGVVEVGRRRVVRVDYDYDDDNDNDNDYDYENDNHNEVDQACWGLGCRRMP